MKSFLFGVLFLEISCDILRAEINPLIEDALHPMTFSSSKNDDCTRLAFKYVTNNETTAYWIYRKSHTFSPVTTQGEIEFQTEGDQTFAESSIELDNMPEGFFGTTQLTFVVATPLAEIVMDIYDPRQLGNTEEELSKTGMKARVPNSIQTTPTPDNDGKQENLTFVIEYKAKDKTDKEIQVRGTYDLQNGVKLRDVSNFDIKESLTDSSTTRIYSIPKHRIKHSEELTFGLDNPGSVTKNQFISLIQYYRAVIHPHDGPKNSPIVFINSTRLFSAESYRYYRGVGEYPLTPEKILLQDHDKYRTISCAAYGYPKPTLHVQHPDGRVLPHVDLQRGSSLTTHIVAELDPLKPVKDLVGTYTCVASNNYGRATKALKVKRVVHPSIVHFGLNHKNDDMVVAECEVTGQPVPQVRFLVNGDTEPFKFFSRRRGRITVKQFDTADGMSRIRIITITRASSEAKTLSCETSQPSVFHWVREMSEEIYI